MKRIFGGSQKIWMIMIGLAVMFLITVAGDCTGTSSSNGCGGPNGQINSGSSYMPYTTVTVKAILEPITPKTAYQPGEYRQTRLKANLSDSGNSTFIWTPPHGATYITLPLALVAVGGPPYTFSNVTQAQANAGIIVGYHLPSSGTSTSEQLEVKQTVSGTLYEDTTTVQYTLSALGGTAMVLPPANNGPQPHGLLPPMVWMIDQTNTFSIPLTALYCQSLISQAQSANIFVALRAPVADTILNNVSYSSPINFGSLDRPQTGLSAGTPPDPTVNATMPMILRPEMTAWANANLPSATGELWTALSVDPGTDLSTACANATGQPEFSLSTFIQLDLSNRPNSCTGCVISTYFCYKNGLLSATLARLFTSGRGSMTFGEYTCLGPDETTLNDYGNWMLTDYTASQVLKPGDTVQLHYYLNNNDYVNAHTFHISSINSPLAVTNWAVHPSVIGDPTTPDMGHTLTGNFSVPAGTQFELYIRGTVPAGAAPNNYPFHMTVASDGVTPASLTGGSILIVTPSGDLPLVANTAPGVSLTGLANPSGVHRGGQVTYMLTIENSGATALTSLVLQDTLPANTTYVSCQGADSCSLNSGVVKWNLASLGTNEQVVLALTVRVNANIPAATTVIHNSAHSVTTAEGATANGSSIDVAVLPYNVYLPSIIK